MGIEYGYLRMPEAELDALGADPVHALTVMLLPPGIDPELMAQLKANPEAAADRAAEILATLENPPPDATRIDLQKDWHALHFLLTGDSSMEPSHDPDNPLHNVVLGGHPTAIEATYGPARRLSRVELSEIVRALSEITVDELRSRFSADEFNAARIYPNPRPGGWDRDEIESVFQIFPRLKQFFEAALEGNEGVLVYSM